MPGPLLLVETPNAIADSVRRFNDDAPMNTERVRRLLNTTSLWVFSVADEQFGPAKFVGFQSMDFDTYEAAVNGQIGGGIFDGHVTRQAIERVLRAEFSERPDLVPQLEIWGDALAGSDAFRGADRTKWRFVEIAAARRNPAWERDELILALDLYVQLGRRVPDDSEPEVVALSSLLNALPIHKERPDQARFRNPNGVALKLANFRALDQPGHGMSRGGKRDEQVWAEFQANPDELHRVASAIRAGYSTPQASSEMTANSDDDEASFPEGRVIYRLHRARERNRAVVERKKAQALRETGRLACEACTFDFGATYRAAGDGYIECHHAAPLADVAGPTMTRVHDLVLLCANCHRIVHRKRPWLAVAAIRNLLR